MWCLIVIHDTLFPRKNRIYAMWFLSFLNGRSVYMFSVPIAHVWTCDVGIITCFTYLRHSSVYRVQSYHLPPHGLRLDDWLPSASSRSIPPLVAALFRALVDDWPRANLWTMTSFESSLCCRGFTKCHLTTELAQLVLGVRSGLVDTRSS